ncbi:MAG: hypothetical protein VKJ64_16800 [Leptolyngbyaceae bacterium]|nr:hypothetical protein [Leptolyngbyaceae bacterium]
MVGKLPSPSQPPNTGLVRRSSASVDAQNLDRLQQDAGDGQNQSTPSQSIRSPLMAEVPDQTSLAIKNSDQRMAQWWLGWLIWLAGTSATSGGAAIAFNVLIALPPETNCYEVVPLTDRTVLSCGYQAVQTNNIAAVLTSLERVKQWTELDPLYPQGLQASAQWSRVLLRQAEHLAQENQLGAAIALIKAVPPTSPSYSLAQRQLVALKHQQLVMQPLVDLAHTAMEQQHWAQAQEQIEALAQLPNDGPFKAITPRARDDDQTEWFDFSQRQVFQVSQLSQRLQLEQSGAAVMQQVEQMAMTGVPRSTTMALQRIREIDPSTYAWAAAQPRMEALAMKLLNHGEWQCQQGDLAGAIATAQQVAAVPALAEEAGYLEQLCRAQELAIATMTPWTPSLQDSLQLIEACAMLKAIPTRSRFHAHTHHHLRQWQAQLEDLRYLHLAHLAASTGWSPTLAWAVQQTEQVAPQRPRRIQAQTLAAHWKLQLAATQDMGWSSQLASTLSTVVSLNYNYHSAQ